MVVKILTYGLLLSDQIIHRAKAWDINVIVTWETQIPWIWFVILLSNYNIAKYRASEGFKYYTEELGEKSKHVFVVEKDCVNKCYSAKECLETYNLQALLDWAKQVMELSNCVDRHQLFFLRCEQTKEYVSNVVRKISSSSKDLISHLNVIHVDMMS
jgi:hypothetical protein